MSYLDMLEDRKVQELINNLDEQEIARLGQEAQKLLDNLPTAEEVETIPEITIYTDGACSGNPGPGGWGAVLTTEWRGIPVQRDYKGTAEKTTNNRMELTAIIESLRKIHAHFAEGTVILVVSDSKYVVDGWMKWLSRWQANGWLTSKKEPVANKDLWLELLSLGLKFELYIEWTKGHAENPLNDRADALARGWI